VAQIGDLKLQAEKTNTYTIPPFLGGGALILGAALIAAGILRRQ
jgi:hypothetical protein